MDKTLNRETHRTGGVDHWEVVAVDVRGAQGTEEGGAEQAGRDLLFSREQRDKKKTVHNHSEQSPAGGKHRQSWWHAQ